MLAQRTLFMSALALSLAVTSACTPAMPPDVAAEVTDRYVNCISGTISIWAAPGAVDAVDQWIEDSSAMCPTMVISRAPDPASADLIVGDQGAMAGSCTVVAKAPVAIDAIVPAMYAESFDGLVMTPQVLKASLAGQVTTWDDSAIRELNPDADLTHEPIVVATGEASNKAWSPFAAWLSRLDASSWQPTDPPISRGDVPSAELGSTEGVLTLVPNTVADDQDLSVVGLVTDAYPDGFFPDYPNFASGATQMVPTTSGSVVSASFDPSVKPLAMDGVSDVADPWQAFVTIDATICAGSHVTAARAVARNMLRHASQAELEAIGLLPLPDGVLYASSGVVAQGLPTPTTVASADNRTP